MSKERLITDLPEAKGTPMALKTPINFRERKIIIEKQNAAAMKKLFLVSFVSFFFIIA